LFHADFTREFVIPEVKGLRSFLTGSVGATHLAAAHDGFTRFSFGFGAGLKQFLGSRLAIRAEAKWLPILIDPKGRLMGVWHDRSRRLSRGPDWTADATV
jgi:hypothetical protein